MKALRKAKLEMINSDSLSHPYYWAGFIISGKANHTIFPNPTYRVLVIGFVCFLMIGIIMVVIRRKKNLA
jgi:hypothetical protein